MNKDLLQKYSAVHDFYNISAIKKRMEGEPVKGAFELAYSDVKRTLRGIGGNKNNLKIKQGLYDILTNLYNDIHNNFECYSLRDYDGSLQLGFLKIKALGDSCDQYITFGQAQKIVNMFFKYMLLADEKLNIHLNYFHVPLDSVMLNGIARGKFSQELRDCAKDFMPWSKSEKLQSYMRLQDGLRELYENPIIFEFKAWSKWQANNK